MAPAVASSPIAIRILAISDATIVSESPNVRSGLDISSSSSGPRSLGVIGPDLVRGVSSTIVPIFSPHFPFVRNYRVVHFAQCFAHRDQIESGNFPISVQHVVPASGDVFAGYADFDSQPYAWVFVRLH